MEDDLRTEVEQNDNLVEGKAKYKKQMIELTQNLEAEDEVERLDRVIKRGNVERVQLFKFLSLY